MKNIKTAKATDNVAYYHSYKYNSMHRLNTLNKMHGVKRVIVFCILIVILPATLIIIPLYLRRSVFADVVFVVAESDILEIRDGISSIFCEQHSLMMNDSFNAFQLQNRPEISSHHKHIRLKKSMTLPDDTLEYWGFYLMKGAKVELKVCSRYEGSRILVVKGDRNLKTCGLLEHNKNKVGAHFAEGHEKVQVTFETVAEELDSTEFSHPRHHHQHSNINNTQVSYSLTADEDENHAGEDLSVDDLNSSKTETVTERTGNAIVKEYSHYFKTENKSYQNSLPEPTTTKTTTMTASVPTYLGRNLNKNHETDTSRNAIHNNLNGEDLVRKNSTGNDASGQKIRHRRHHGKQIKSAYRATPPQARKHHIRQLREKRDDHVLDRKYTHGGNAGNLSENESNSISSFENSLLTCYDGQILLAQGFDPSSACSSVHFLESGSHMVATHEVVDDGYYYYIFYSDNDIVRNDIHAVFDIHKPTYKYANITESKFCLNSSNCTFPVRFLSDEIVIVEVPTRDGIDDDGDDFSYLISTCHPRMSVYMIFPISVLFFILTCAFL